jgi:tetratricopeptide (TPR) repeat protein
VTLTEPSPTSTPDVLAPELEEPYRRLLRVLRAGQGMFTLVPVESNLTEDEREEVLRRLREDLAAEGLALREVELTYNDWDPVEVLEKELGTEAPESVVLLLSGLERTPTGRLSEDGIARPPAFLRLNQARELLEQSYPVPMIVWCEPYTYGTLRRHAPDFFDHFTGLVRFLLPHRSSRRDGVGSLGRQVAAPPWASSKDVPSTAAVRFYEERLERPSLGAEERSRALLGLAEALAGLRESEGIQALERAAEAAKRAIRLLAKADLEAWSRAHRLQATTRTELGQPGKGLRAAEEAVAGYAQLALENPAAFLPDLAWSLHSQSNLLGDLGRWDDALIAIEKAVEIRRELAQESPDIYRRSLCHSLDGLSLRLGSLGRTREALEVSEEAVKILLEMMRDQPVASLQALANSLNNLSLHLSNLGRQREALAASEEAVEIFRVLARQRPAAYGPRLATSLGGLHLRLAESGQEPAALEAIQEALDLLEPYFRHQPAAHAPVMQWVTRDYERAAKACEVPPDEDRLRSIRELLETVEGDDSAAA